MEEEDEKKQEEGAVIKIKIVVIFNKRNILHSLRCMGHTCSWCLEIVGDVFLVEEVCHRVQTLTIKQSHFFLCFMP